MALRAADQPRLMSGFTPQEIMRVTAPHFETTGDRRSRIWVFSPNRPALHPRGVRWFGAGDQGAGRLTVFEVFGGRSAFLLNHDVIVDRRDVPIVSRPTIVLDTHVQGLLEAYLVPRPKAEATREARRLADRAIVYQFVRFAVGTGFDYNPFFSILETMVKEPDAAQRHARVRRCLATVLAFHTMDENRFVDTSHVVLDRRALARYEDAYGVAGLEAVAHERAERLLGQPVGSQVRRLERSTYVVLLKAVLLRYAPGTLSERLDALRAFVDEHIRLQMGREEVSAALLFAGKRTPLPELQRNTDPAVFCQRVGAASWDLLFLRMPEYLLTLGDVPEFTVAYLCTRDRALAALGATCHVDLVADGEVTRVVPPVVLSFDLEELAALVGEETTRALRVGGDMTARLSTRLGSDRRPPPDEAELDALVIELERAVGAIATGRRAAKSR